MLRGKRVIIEKLGLSDVYQMMNWKKAEDMLKREYHFLTTKNGDIEGWYNARISVKNMMSFAVKTSNGKVIGFISIRDISKLFKSSVLGITFDVNYWGMGYGTESLELFLKYYFNDLKMKKIILDVAIYNKRAIGCYQKIGFKLTRKYYARLEDDYYDTMIDQLSLNTDPDFRESLCIVGPFILVGYYKMHLKRAMYKSVV